MMRQKKLYGKNYDNLLKIHELSQKPDKNSGDILNDIIDKTEFFVRRNGRLLTTSQLRNIYAKIKPETNPNKAILLRPKLAYISARQRRNEAKIIPDFISEQLRLVDGNEDRLKSLKNADGNDRCIPQKILFLRLW